MIGDMTFYCDDLTDSSLCWWVEVNSAFLCIEELT